jgi:tape measure domain-containing protein
MNTEQGRLYYATCIDNSKLREDAAESRNILAGIGQSAETQGERMDAAFGKIGKAVGAIFATQQITEFMSKIVAARGEIESLQISFETLAGKSKGNQLFNDIREFAVSTPMMMKDLAAGAQTMLAFNIEAEKVMPILRAIGDISMGDSQKFTSLALSFSQMSATGKLMGQDLLQMINAGFNPLSVISEKTGKSIGELKKEMESGAITTEMVTEAFITATSAGGKFYGMLEKQSKGINGAISNLQGAIEDMFNDLGSTMQGGITSTIEFATQVVKHYEIIGTVLLGVTAAYGLQKAQLIALQAVEQARAATSAETVAAITAELGAIGTKTALQQLEIDTDLAAAVAKGELTTAQGLEILSAKQAAAARVEAIAASAAMAKADAVAATAARVEAGERLKAAEINAAAMRMEYQAALAKGEVFEIAVAKTAVETATTQVNAASEQYQAAATAETTAAKKAKTLATEASTAQTSLETAAINANTAAQTTNTSRIALAALLKTKLATATSGLIKILGSSATIYTLVGAAVGGLAYGYYKQGEEARELARKQAELNKAINDTERASVEETTQISILFSRLKNAEKGSKAYQAAKDEILSKYGEYLKGLSSEIQSLTDVAGAYDAITKAATEAARARALANISKDESDALANARGDAYDRIKAHLTRLYRDRTNKDGAKYVDLYLEHFSNVLDGREQFSERDRALFSRKDAAGKKYNPIEDIIIAYQKKEGESAARVSEAGKRLGISNKATEAEEEALYQATVADLRKKLATAESKIKRLKADPKAKDAEVKAAMEERDAALKDLKDRGIDTSSEAKAGNKAADIRKDNEDMLANEAAKRLKEEEEYAQKIADQVRDNEAEIQQARIDAMSDGIDKELAQNQLNYNRLLEQNKRREREMLDELAEARVRAMENADPYVFKRKNDEGKWEDNPGAREASYRAIRSHLTREDLPTQQYAQLGEFERIATETFEKANKDSLDKMLADVMTYEQQRLKIEEEYARKRAALYEHNEDGSVKTDASGNKVFKQGVDQGNADELDRQEKEAMDNLQKTFADRGVERLKLSIDWEKAFGDLDSVATSSLKRIKQKLQEYIKTQKDLDPENIKALLEAIEKIDGELTSRNPFEALGKSFNDLATANANVKKAQDEYNKKLKTGNDLEKEQAASALNAAKNAKQKALADANKSIQATCNNLQEYIGLATALSDMLAAFGVEIPEELTGLLEGFSNALSGFESMDLTRPVSIITGAIKGVTGIFQGIGSLFGFGKGDEKKDKAIETRQQQIEDLQRAYEKLGKKVDDVYSKDAQKLLEQQNEMLEAQKILIQNQISQEQSKKHSDSGRIREWEQQLEELNELIDENKKKAEDAIFGEDIKSAIENFSDAMTAAWTRQEDTVKSVRDVVKRMMQQMVKESINAAIQSSSAMDRIRKQLAIFFTDNKLTPWEQEYIYKLGEELQKDIEKEYGWAESLFAEDAEREGSQKGIATADQESIDELNGRMTAVQSHTFSISENTKQLLTTTQSILLSLLHIEEETDGLHDRMERVENYTKSMHNSLDYIVTNGVKLK